MSSDSPELRPSSSAPSQTATSGPVCPRCGGALRRIPRRMIDVLCHPIRAVARYHCKVTTCDWIGNLRRTASDPIEVKRSGPKVL